MEGQEASLSLRKSTHVEWTAGVETHAAQGLHVGRGRKQDIAVVLEPNETAVEEVVRGRRQEKAVLAVKALLVVGVAPRLAVAGPQVLFLSWFTPVMRQARSIRMTRCLMRISANVTGDFGNVTDFDQVLGCAGKSVEMVSV